LELTNNNSRLSEKELSKALIYFIRFHEKIKQGKNKISKENFMMRRNKIRFFTPKNIHNKIHKQQFTILKTQDGVK